MELKLDTEKFDELQGIFVREIAEQVRFKLAQNGITGDQLRDLTGEITFSVTSSLDDIARIEADGVEVSPYLTFRTTEEELTHCGENSYGHELVAEINKKMFSK
jgi:hypothetical protein